MRKTELQSSGAKMTGAPTNTRINLTDLVQLVCGDRVENFPFERHIAIMTFSVWLWHRDQLPVVEYGKLIAAAKVITEVNRGARNRRGPERAQTARTIFEAVATPERTAELLLQNPMMGLFRDDMDFRSDVWRRGSGGRCDVFATMPSRAKTESKQGVFLFVGRRLRL